MACEQAHRHGTMKSKKGGAVHAICFEFGRNGSYSQVIVVVVQKKNIQKRANYMRPLHSFIPLLCNHT